MLIQSKSININGCVNTFYITNNQKQFGFENSFLFGNDKGKNLFINDFQITSLRITKRITCFLKG